MIYVDELKNMIIYKKKAYLPVSDTNRRKGNCCIILSPNIEGSINTINFPMFINNLYDGYYIEKDITYYINQENALIEDISSVDILLETNYNTIDQRYLFNDYNITENRFDIKLEDGRRLISFFGDTEEELIQEGSSDHNKFLRKLLYNERFRKPKEVINIHKRIKEKCPNIDRTYLYYDRYKSFNLFVDFYYYNEVFFKNNLFRLDKGLDLYFEFITRFFNDKRLLENGYTDKCVLINVEAWDKVISSKNIVRYNESINPLSIIFRLIQTDLDRLKNTWGNIPFIFFGPGGYFKIDFSILERKDIGKYKTYLSRILSPSNIEDKESNIIGDTKKAMVSSVLDKIESTSKIKINNLTGGDSTTKEELVKRIEDAAVSSKDAKDLESTIEEDKDIKRLIHDVITTEDDTVKISAQRQKRVSELRKSLRTKNVDNVSIDDLLTKSFEDIPIKSTEIKIDSPNEEWKDMSFINFNDGKDPIHESVRAMDNLSNSKKIHPISIRHIETNDISTSESYMKQVTYHLEDENGNRYKVDLNIPEVIDGKFLMLSGNIKSVQGQLMFLPVVKISPDRVQVVSDYNKIFIYRYGPRGYVISDRILKALSNVDKSKYEIKYGNSSKSNLSYELPIDYDELSSNITYIKIKNLELYLDQDALRKKYDIKDNNKSFPIGVLDKKVIYCDYDKIYSNEVLNLIIDQDPSFRSIYEETGISTKYQYSRVSILSNELPLILVLTYSEGLFAVLKKAKIKYSISDKRPKIDYNNQDVIRFKDGYIVYDLTYESSLLMNGLKDCPTELYSLKEVDSKSMYLDFLDKYGGRILADGLDNFYTQFTDSIQDILPVYELPTDYVELLIYANDMLSDNKYTRHTSMDVVRYRGINEIINACTNRVISKAYGDYQTEVKRGRKNAKFTIDKDAVVKEIMNLNTTADASVLNPVYEAETIAAVSYKGPSGMNNDRAYQLEKRAYDKTMVNLIALSTPNSATVGVNRQVTMDMNIANKSGSIKTTKSNDEISLTKSFSVSEALNPIGISHDDPPRVAINLSQAKHMIKVKEADPMIMTNGTDMALPYMVSSLFSNKAKYDGEVLELNDDYMIVRYKDNNLTEMILLREEVHKNSSSGFFIKIKKTTDLKKGSKFKANDILAYDSETYSNKIGHTDNISYTVGPLARIAVLNNDDGYEDSVILSERICNKMRSDIIIEKSINIDKLTNIFGLVKPGDPIQEGDPLVIIQDTFQEKDIQELLKNLVVDEDEVTDIGRINIKSRYTGTIQDVKIYTTVDKKELSPSLQKAVNDISKKNKELKSVMKKYNINTNKLQDPEDILDPSGRLKNSKDGVMISFFIKYEDIMSVGDKMTFFGPVKGVQKDIFPLGEEPFIPTKANEKIDGLLTLASVDARQVYSLNTIIAGNAVMVELFKQVREILNIKIDDEL